MSLAYGAVYRDSKSKVNPTPFLWVFDAGLIHAWGWFPHEEERIASATAMGRARGRRPDIHNVFYNKNIMNTSAVISTKQNRGADILSTKHNLAQVSARGLNPIVSKCLEPQITSNMNDQTISVDSTESRLSEAMRK